MPSPRARQVIGRALQTPAQLDRRGLRWMIKLTSPAPVYLLVHRGRRSGKLYKTPVEAIAEYPERGEIVISPLWGEQSHWYRNVLAGGLVEVVADGEPRRFDWRAMDEAERRRALGAYRTAHPIYHRLVFRALVWAHGLEGDRFDAIAREIPMLGLHPEVGAPAV